MYRVIQPFTDIQDANHVYFTGDEYPRKGAKPDQQRIEELAATKNRLGYALIRAVEGSDDVEHILDQETPKKPARSRKKTV